MSNLITIHLEVDLGVNAHDGTATEEGKGYVYIIESDDCIKIGKTRNVTHRIKTLQKQSGRNFKRVCHTSQCKNYSDVEIALHKEFEGQRTIGEWFNIGFDQAMKKLSTYDLDVSDVAEKESPTIEILKALGEEFANKEIDTFLNERPIFRDYLKANGFRVYLYESSGEILVTNDDDVEMSLRLFLAIYKYHTA